MIVTVFTPTYNRAYILPKLYESLSNQICKNFEWIIVDDGSTDNTKELIEKWENDAEFPIKYLFVPNGGKHRAINQGVKLAKGLLFFIVDSDDQLPRDSIDIINKEYSNIKNNEYIGGLCGVKAYFNGEKVGGEQNFGTLICSSLDFRYKHNIKGDMAEVYKTSILKEFPFPDIPNEKFCPEAVVWQRISQKYKLYYFYKKIYMCDYLPDGLTAKITKIRMQCPVASTICYRELVELKIPLMQKIRASINYWRFWFCFSVQKKTLIRPIWYITYPLGLIMHLNDLRTNSCKK